MYLLRELDKVSTTEMLSDKSGGYIRRFFVGRITALSYFKEDDVVYFNSKHQIHREDGPAIINNHENFRAIYFMGKQIITSIDLEYDYISNTTSKNTSTLFKAIYLLNK